MALVQLDPPGTWCINRAFLEMLAPLSGVESFIEIGPGEGSVSRMLCDKGLTGTGIDFSPIIMDRLGATMREYIRSGQYSTIQADLLERVPGIQADLVFGMMVLEHVEPERAFLGRMVQMVRPEGKLVVTVPARPDRWGIEDELSGHYRRYNRADLAALFRDAGLEDVRIWSVTAPIANCLRGLSNLALARSAAATRRELARREQTQLSGLKDVPYKTLFPSWFKFVLNRHTMYPLVALQRLFYRTDLGLALMAGGTKR